MQDPLIYNWCVKYHHYDEDEDGYDCFDFDVEELPTPSSL